MKLSPKTLLKNIKSDTIFEVQKKSFKIFPRLTLKALKILEKGKKLKNKTNQILILPRGVIKIVKLIGTLMRKNVYNFIRAITYPYNGAFAYFLKVKVRIYQSKISNYSPKKVGIGNLFFDKKKFIRKVQDK